VECVLKKQKKAICEIIKSWLDSFKAIFKEKNEEEIKDLSNKCILQALEGKTDQLRTTMNTAVEKEKSRIAIGQTELETISILSGIYTTCDNLQYIFNGLEKVIMDNDVKVTKYNNRIQEYKEKLNLLKSRIEQLNVIDIDLVFLDTEELQKNAQKLVDKIQLR